MGNTVNDRELILEILLAVTRDGEYSHIALRNVLENYQYLDKSERAFITRVTEGTLERMIELDYIINQFSKTKVNKMKPVIRTIIRSAVYQLKYMDSVPDSAVCNEAVKLAGKRGFSGLKGFVNGVLRNISRNLDNVKYPDKSDTVKWLSVMYSMPEWIITEWLKNYDREMVEKILLAFLAERPTTIRCNLSQISREELAEELKKEGLWFVCADMGGTTMYDLNLTGPIGLVIGNEGEGVGRLVKEKCDYVASIPMKGDIDSLNASVAAGVLAYEIVRQRMN